MVSTQSAFVSDAEQAASPATAGAAAPSAAAEAAGIPAADARAAAGQGREADGFVVCPRFDDLGAQDRVRRRLGVFGGTFDPIHIGHLAAAERVRQDLDLDAVVFLPAGVPVFKKDRRVTAASERLQLCRIAVADNPHFDVSPMEVVRGGDTYTVDTLRIMRAHYPDNVELFFITGADAIMDIAKWRQAEALGALARFVALTRPGYEVDQEKRAEIEAATNLGVIYRPIPGFSVSSSMIRRNVANGRSIRYLVTEPVRQRIEDMGLYR